MFKNLLFVILFLILNQTVYASPSSDANAYVCTLAMKYRSRSMPIELEGYKWVMVKLNSEELARANSEKLFIGKCFADKPGFIQFVNRNCPEAISANGESLECRKTLVGTFLNIEYSD